VAAGDADRDQLMCALLQLASILVRRPLTLAARQAGSKSTTATTDVEMVAYDPTVHAGLAAADEAEVVIDSPMTDVSSRLSQSGVVMTSTPNLANEDTTTDCVTDEQKTQTSKNGAMSVAAATVTASTPVTSVRWSSQKPCSHDVDTNRLPAVADIVARNRSVMGHLIEALGNCNSSTIAMLLASSGLPTSISDSFSIDPVSKTMSGNLTSVGDGVFHLLTVLNSSVTDLSLIVEPVYRCLAGRLHASAPQNVCHLSEPLLWLMLRVLDCRSAIQSFIDMGMLTELLCTLLTLCSLVFRQRRIGPHIEASLL